jgi:hypothetical protein
MRELSQLLCPLHSTVYWHLTQSQRFTMHHLRLVPRFLTAEQKRISVDMAGEPLLGFSGQMLYQWHGILIFDGAWVSLQTEHEMMSVCPGEPVSGLRAADHTVT